MAKDYTCWDCGYYGGVHEPTCSRKGYMNPSEPKPAPVVPAPRVECPCGIARTDCDYHRPAPAAPYEYGAFDSGADDWTGQHMTCTCRACTIARKLCDITEMQASAASMSNGFWVVNGPGVFVYDDAGEQIELLIGAQIPFEVMP